MSTVRTCPACGATLATAVHEEVEVDTCPSGCGVWLDRGELKAVVDREEVDRPIAEEDAAIAAAAAGPGDVVRDARDRAPRACPVCHGAMRVREYPGSGVALDECDAHGVWLDAGELERIEAYAEGMRRMSAGATSPTPGPVRGIPVPPELLAGLRAAVRPRA